MAIGKKSTQVFLVDDDPMQIEMLRDFLSDKYDYQFRLFNNAEEAIKALNINPQFVILDYHLEGRHPGAMNGIEALKTIRQQQPKSHVIMLSGQDKIEVAVDSLRLGARDYVIKGETAFNRLGNIIDRLRELDDIKQSNNTYKRAIGFMVVLYAALFCFAVYEFMRDSLGVRF
ncbi:MAG: response regulator [Chitinophagia bacterium]|nr:response regulator [Chitinophagia bacterium]